MNSASEFNYKIIVKTFRIILETLRRRVWRDWRIFQASMQFLRQKKYKRIVKIIENGNQKWDNCKSKITIDQDK